MLQTWSGPEAIGRSTFALTELTQFQTFGGNVPGDRVLSVDLARSIAILCMIVFHFVRDLEMFGLVPAETTLSGGWAFFARAIAGSFLFLSGVSAVLAHRNGFHLGAWTRRLAVISTAALLVTLATYAAFPSRFIYFGILHAIAACSVLGLPFLFAPAWGAAVGVAGVLWLWFTFGREYFDLPWLAWTGLSSNVPPAFDFIPVIPWLAAFLAGIVAAKAVRPPTRSLSTPHSRLLAWPGRHSLVIYLVHQPFLIAVVWLIARIA